MRATPTKRRNGVYPWQPDTLIGIVNNWSTQQTSWPTFVFLV